MTLIPRPQFTGALDACLAIIDTSGDEQKDGRAILVMIYARGCYGAARISHGSKGEAACRAHTT